MSKEIVQIPHPALREVSKEVPVDEIASDTTVALIADLREALESQDDGIGISAPQIAETKRVFVVSHRIFDGAPGAQDMIFINPVITWQSKKTDTAEEGCLSIRGVYGQVERPSSVKVESYNEVGDKLEYEAHGLLARVMQHEIDHLDGVLFIDKATDIKEIPYEG